ncbi:methionine biosynthesis protein MetW [Candidatus Velamenicoccus archaeovorus]|uniref:Methionine biosynthesis protein MetW n=1 Tax=Velamenicoccus archaeovorus TaxID=1930593 RepID=A0A410P5Q4_VELA1|nr:methionine biosynthesis protein MetW [Candidatus Velamenicoccus archaeovorus]QAT17411.1 methionine biosynthesis protein MetW [Candidatus Velamenicoccus archaeovorus]
MTFNTVRLDHKIIYQIVEPGSRVLDLGCGEGDLIYFLAKEKGAHVQGIELSEEAIYRCVEKGLSVFHSDIDSGLIEYPDKSFDYVILNQSMQETRKVDFVLKEALRVGKNVIVGFPNFAYVGARLRLFFLGETPVTPSLPYRWYNTPNLHFLSISDFRNFCDEKNIRILHTYYLGRRRLVRIWPNLFALSAIFVIHSSS